MVHCFRLTPPPCGMGASMWSSPNYFGLLFVFPYSYVNTNFAVWSLDHKVRLNLTWLDCLFFSNHFTFRFA